MKRIAFACLVLFSFAALQGQQGNEPVDFNKARQLLERRQRGQTLTRDEQAYLERAMAERRKQPGRPANQRPAPARLTPLSDMSASDWYEGEDGGLYGGGRNTPTEAHRRAAEAELAKIRPLDAEGEPDENGVIGFIAISMSNATQEFSRFKQVADRSPLLLWGPYLWAEGTKGRKTDSLVWDRADFGPDGVHPSDFGRQKVAQLLLDFFTTHPLAKSWFTHAPRILENK